MTAYDHDRLYGRCSRCGQPLAPETMGRFTEWDLIDHELVCVDCYTEEESDPYPDHGVISEGEIDSDSRLLDWCREFVGEPEPPESPPPGPDGEPF